MNLMLLDLAHQNFKRTIALIIAAIPHISFKGIADSPTCVANEGPMKFIAECEQKETQKVRIENLKVWKLTKEKMPLSWLTRRSMKKCQLIQSQRTRSKSLFSQQICPVTWELQQASAESEQIFGHLVCSKLISHR